MKARLLKNGRIALDDGTELAPGDPAHLRLVNFLRGEPLTFADSWSAFRGPYGGQGWRNSSTGETRYQADSPSSRAGKAAPSTNGHAQANGKPHVTPSANGSAKRSGTPSTNGHAPQATPGAAKGNAVPVDHEQTTADAEHVIQRPSFLAAAARLPIRVASAAKSFCDNLYARTEKKYGKTWARRVLATAVITFPIPFPGASIMATAAMTGLAHLMTAKSRAAETMADDQGADLGPDQLKAAATDFLKDLAAGLTQIAAKLKDSGKLPIGDRRMEAIEDLHDKKPGAPVPPPIKNADMTDRVSVLTVPANKKLIEEFGEGPSKFKESLERAAKDVDRNPSEEQKKSGNYRKGHATIQGLGITLETPRGAMRSGKSKDGKEWSVKMASHYGYIKRTESEADGDHVDVFIGPDPESEIVFVIDQTDADGAFDEHKAMLGFTNAADARAAYLASHSPGWRGFRGMKALPMGAFKWWIKDGDTGAPIEGQAIKFAETWSSYQGPEGGRGWISSTGEVRYQQASPSEKKWTVSTVGENHHGRLLHGTTAKSAKAFTTGGDLPESERSKTISEWGPTVIYASDHDAPHQAMMFGHNRSHGKGGQRMMLEFQLKKGAKILDAAHEMTRRPAMTLGNEDRIIKFKGRPSFTDDLMDWLNEQRVKNGHAPANRERLAESLDPSSKDFYPDDYLPYLARYAKDRGFAAIRLADETVIVDRNAIESARKLKPKEVEELKAKPRLRKPYPAGSLYTNDPDESPPHGAVQMGEDFARFDDIYHGPQAPKEGTWIPWGTGELGGKRWKRVPHSPPMASDHQQPDPTVPHHPPEHGQAMYVPNPLAPNAETGIPDHARVGVPAMSSPPPPDSIGRLPNLDEKQRKVESRFAGKYLADPDKMVDKYLKALRKGKVGAAPNIFATDDVKMLNPDWNPGKHREGEKLGEDSRKAMAKYNAAVHQTANALSKRAFLKYLDDVVMKLPEDKRSVLVTNGGCAAGKGSMLSHSNDPTSPYYGLNPAASEVGAVWDSAGEANATENPWIYQECQKRGLRMISTFVWAEPSDTWDGPERGVIRRAMRKGRMVDARLFADSYALGAQNMKAFVDRYGDRPGLEFIFLDNRDKKTPKLLPAFPEETLRWDADAIYKMAADQLKARAGELDKSLIKGGMIGATIWGPPPGHEKFGEDELPSAGLGLIIGNLFGKNASELTPRDIVKFAINNKRLFQHSEALARGKTP
jgi:hypothetical protein